MVMAITSIPRRPTAKPFSPTLFYINWYNLRHLYNTHRWCRASVGDNLRLRHGGLWLRPVHASRNAYSPKYETLEGKKHENCAYHRSRLWFRPRGRDAARREEVRR